ncbi:hypothetical protein [Pontimicrobium sp. SW4]|uniref:Uncharacterized protein n=1 Tax=Pontimicrobium sp. SW4 TaxID=3153519 RepID=A0AAU7BR88_9FLAO
MKYVFIITIVLFCFFTQQKPERTVKENRIVSDAQPNITIEVDKEYEFIGKLNFVLFNSAEVERYLFAVVENDSIKKMLTFQFEAYLPDNEYTYKKNYNDSILLGDHWFGKENINAVNVLHIRNFIDKWKGKGLEHEVTYGYLEENNYEYEDVVLSDFLVNYASDYRSELVVAYYENMSNFGLQPEKIGLDDKFVRVTIGGKENSKNDKSPITRLKQNMMNSFKIIKE